jgi:hypothetical protein
MKIITKLRGVNVRWPLLLYRILACRVFLFRNKDKPSSAPILHLGFECVWSSFLVRFLSHPNSTELLV